MARSVRFVDLTPEQSHMVQQFTDATGGRWRAETSGGPRYVMGMHTVGIWFIDEATGWRVYGGLNPADAERPSDERLRGALQSALEDLLDGKPEVWMVYPGPEMFEINDLRYVRLVGNPGTANGPGAFRDSFHDASTTFDEVALRAELPRLGFSDDQMTVAVALARKCS